MYLHILREEVREVPNDLRFFEIVVNEKNLPERFIERELLEARERYQRHLRLEGIKTKSSLFHNTILGTPTGYDSFPGYEDVMCRSYDLVNKWQNPFKEKQVKEKEWEVGTKKHEPQAVANRMKKSTYRTERLKIVKFKKEGHIFNFAVPKFFESFIEDYESKLAENATLLSRLEKTEKRVKELEEEKQREVDRFKDKKDKRFALIMKEEM